MTSLVRALKSFLLFTFLLGLVYPAVTILTGKIFFFHRANGSLAIVEGRVVGSYLIAQEFKGDEYFHSRPSAIEYNTSSSGSNSSVVSGIGLYNRVKKQAVAVRVKNHLGSKVRLPADMVFNSASGLDPHISVANAKLQVPRIAKVRKLTKQKIHKLIFSCIDSDFVGIWGDEGVNVLKLNLLLDSFENSS